MIGTLKDMTKSRDGKWIVSFVTPEDFSEQFDSMYGKSVDVQIKVASKHRSLNANAYAWVLIDKIAEVTGIKVTEVYRNAIREIGGISYIYGVKEEAFESFKEIWIGKHLGRQVEIVPGSNKPGWLNVKAWKGSSDFSVSQMARFIDSLIQDAEALGIPTITEKQAEKLLGDWSKRQTAVANKESEG